MAQSDKSLVEQLERIYNSPFCTPKMRRRLIKRLRSRRRTRIARNPSLMSKLRGLS